MSDTITANGTINFAIQNVNVNGSTSLIYYPTTSQITANIQSVAMSSWQGLATSSLGNIRYIYVRNDGPGTVNLAMDASGTKVASILGVNDWAFLPWTGSTGIYAQAYANAAVITTIVASQ